MNPTTYIIGDHMNILAELKSIRTQVDALIKQLEPDTKPKVLISVKPRRKLITPSVEAPVEAAQGEERTPESMVSSKLTNRKSQYKRALKHLADPELPEGKRDFYVKLKALLEQAGI